MKIINNFPKLTKLDNIENELNSKAPIMHATNTIVYGGGTSSEYGHVKLSDNYKTSDGTADSGVAASSKAVTDAYAEINSRFKQYDYNSDTSDAMKLTTDVLEAGLYLALIQESVGPSNRSTPSFAIIYVNNGMWLNWQKPSDSVLDSITYSGGKITFTLSNSKFLFVTLLNCGF